jgi:hypothetical protein
MPEPFSPNNNAGLEIALLGFVRPWFIIVFVFVFVPPPACRFFLVRRVGVRNNTECPYDEAGTLAAGGAVSAALASPISQTPLTRLLLSHASIQISYNTYSSLLAEQQRNAFLHSAQHWSSINNK